MILFIALVPLWLFGVIFPPTLDPTNRELLQFATLSWLPIVGTFLGWGRFLVGPLFRERSVILWVTGASLLALAANALLSEDPLHSLGYVLTVALGLVCCAGIWEIVGTRVVTCLSIYSILGTLMGIYTYFIGERVQGRLSIGDAHPNYLGLVSFGFLVSALAIPNRLLAGSLIAINLFIIVDTQSRTVLGAGLLALLVFAALKAKQISKRRAAFALVGLALVLGLLVLIYSDVVAYWISSLFFLNDKYRGLGTGFTGRVEAWQEALDMFFNNPAFGVGFRMHERYMNTLSSAHNGYLSLLAEVGRIGVVPLISHTSGRLALAPTSPDRGSRFDDRIELCGRLRVSRRIRASFSKHGEPHFTFGLAISYGSRSTPGQVAKWISSHSRIGNLSSTS